MKSSQEETIREALEEGRQMSQLFGNPHKTQYFRDALVALEEMRDELGVARLNDLVISRLREERDELQAQNEQMRKDTERLKSDNARLRGSYGASLVMLEAGQDTGVTAPPICTHAGAVSRDECPYCDPTPIAECVCRKPRKSKQ
jgi:hypothetical protein